MPRHPLWAAILLLAACSAGGTVRPPPPVDLGPPPPRRYYDAPPPVPDVRATEIQHVERHLEIRRVLLPPRMPDALRHLSHASDPIEVFLFLPRPLGAGRYPVVLMAPVLANSMLLMNEFATAFTRKGWIAAVAMRKEFDFDPKTALAQAEGEFRTYVMQSRQVLDWLETRPWVDPDRLATFGVSAGATISACVAGVDDRPVAHVLVLAGGPLADVLSDTTEDRFVEYRRALADGSGIDPSTLRARLRETLRTDPVRLGGGVDPAKVLLVLARRDTSIPTRYGLQLWEAMGRPRLHMLPFGHYTSFALLPLIANRATRFMAARFEGVR